jgi:hypothetical protein
MFTQSMLTFIGMNHTCAELAANGDGISCLAFQLWEEAGCPEGRDLEFWMGSETRLLAPQRHKMDTNRMNAATSFPKQIPAALSEGGSIRAH